MQKSKTLLVTLVLFLTSLTALAGTSDLSWLKATKNCDGTAIAEPVNYKIWWGTQGTLVPGTTLSYQVQGLSPGLWWFSIASVDAKGVESQFLTVTKTVTPAEFKAIATTAYMALRQKDRLIVAPVGTVPLGTVCDPKNGVVAAGVSYFAVPIDSVTSAGGGKPEVIFAQCG